MIINWHYSKVGTDNTPLLAAGSFINLESLAIGFRLLAASQVLLFLLMLRYSNNPPRVRLHGGFLVFGILVYLLTPVLPNLIGTPATIKVAWFATIIPFMLLLFVWVVFEDSVRYPYWLLILLFMGVALACWQHAALLTHSLPNPKIVLQVIKLLAIFATVYLLWRGRDADLIETRAKLRTILVAVIALFVLLVITIELVMNFTVPLPLEALGMAAIFISALLVNFLFFRANPSLRLFNPPAPKAQSSEDPFITSLLAKMTEQRLYASHDLRIAGLAEIMQVPEYQLRRKINTELGYRNFNRFINRYRIQEASERLISEPQAPVLSIALDVGFKSISAFNAAFLDRFGVSPTQFRNQSGSET